MKEARFYSKEKGNSVRCTACEWTCVIAEGTSGICGVRANKEGVLYSLVYGQVNDAYADWIEKKKLAHFLPGSMAFSIGTIGCNFGCDYCCNWQFSQGSKIIREELRKKGTLSDLFMEISSYGNHLSPENVVKYCERKQYPVIAYTYNEPTVFIEYAIDIAGLARKKGIKSVFVTNGYMSEEAVSELSTSMDAVAIDIKSFKNDFYRKHCKASIDPVLRNIKLFAKAGMWLELTTLLVPGENDSIKEIRNIAAYIAAIDRKIPWHITQFTPDYKLLDKPRTPADTMYRAYDIAKAEGLEYVYFGNLWDSDKTSTWCPKCKTRLIYRDVYDIRIEPEFNNAGMCRECGETIPGVWT
jgi:pyruvate formate lyase activating enzyme